METLTPRATQVRRSLRSIVILLMAIFSVCVIFSLRMCVTNCRGLFQWSLVMRKREKVQVALEMLKATDKMMALMGIYGK